MFKKLQHQFMFLALLGAGLILVIILIFSLIYSATQLNKQNATSFHRTVDSIVTHFQNRDIINYTWLLQTESQHQLYISIEMQGQPIAFTYLDHNRDSLIAAASKQLQANPKFRPKEKPKTLLPETLFFTMKRPELARVAISKIPWEEDWILVTVVKTRTDEIKQITILTAWFACISILGLLCLGFFFWYFSGKAIQPIKENHEKQIDFISSASHELRSPLAVIQATAGAIQKSTLEQAKIFAATIDSECSRLNRLIRDLLLLASAENETIPFHPTQQQPETLVIKTGEAFQSLAKQKDITLVVEIPDYIMQKSYYDSDRLQQLLSIFIDNALEYTPCGGKIVLSTLEKRARTVFTVSDSGPGIPVEDREKIFERFYRRDASRTDKQHYGIGLSIAFELAKLHKATLLVEDSILGGASFSVVLPLKHAQGNIQ